MLDINVQSIAQECHQETRLPKLPATDSNGEDDKEQRLQVSRRRNTPNKMSTTINVIHMNKRIHLSRSGRLTISQARHLMTLCMVVAMVSLGCGSLVKSEGSSMQSQVAKSIQTSGARLARKLELAKSSQINDWLVHQVAPAMAGKLIESVIPKKAASSPAKESFHGIDTQALADKIVDKLADSVKKRVKQQQVAAEESNESREAQEKPKGLNRKGKSLVGDIQSLFSKDNRKLFGRAMEKSRYALRGSMQQQHHGHQNNSWKIVQAPNYDTHQFTSTESNLLDENPVVLRAEHGKNLTTTTSTESPYLQHQQDNMVNGGNLSPLISSLMSSSQTNQMGNKLLQRHRHQQQKYVHTNRHQQHQLAPKPWPAPNQAHNRRQQQSPYSLSVTSDMNIVQAPSSPPPPAPVEPSTPPSVVVTSSSTQTMPVFALMPAAGSNAYKFKFNNRHQQPAGNWNSNQRNHYPSNNHRFQSHHPASSTTTSTTTTTTTTTTTPEPPPPPTETVLMDGMESLGDLDQQTSAPSGLSILSSVAQSALESLSQEDYGSFLAGSNNNSSYGLSNNSSSHHSSGSNTNNQHQHSIVSGGTKGAATAHTSARHSPISPEAIPTALGAPLYHLNRANFTALSIMGPSAPPRRSMSSPAAKVMVQYFQKGLNNISSNIFGRQSKSWARRLGVSSVLLSLLYGAAVLANPGAPLPTNGFEILQALAKNKRRRGSRESLIPVAPMVEEANKPSNVHGSLSLSSDSTVNILYQQPQLIPIIEHLIQQEQLQQQQQQQNGILTQRSFHGGPMEIENYDS